MTKQKTKLKKNTEAKVKTKPKDLVLAKKDAKTNNTTDKQVTKVNPQKTNNKTYTNPVSLWDFRINSSETKLKELQAFLKKYAKHWAFQLEQGEKTQYEHFQGRLSLISRKRKMQLLKLFEENTTTPNYLQPTNNNSFGEWFYVLKEETRIDGPWKDTDEEIYIPKHLENAMLNPYPFQQKILESVNEKDTRSVNVIYDPIGCSGKTTVAAWLCTTSSGILVPICRNTGEIIQYVCSLCIPNKIRKPSPIFIDLPRAMQKNTLHEVYSAVEILKTGLLYDTRFSGKRWTIESPIIWIFTNVEPDPDWLSKDRWKLWAIDPTTKDLIVYKFT